MQRDEIAKGIAIALWERVGSGGRMPSPLLRAGEDLVALYEEANDLPMEDIRLRLNEEVPGARLSRDLLRTEGTDDWFAWAALGDAPEHVVDLMHAAGVAVPSFTIKATPAGYRDEVEITWEGAPERRNPANSGEHMMLLEDDPILQDGTGRWMKRIMPGTPLIVVDNVDAAIANLKHHNLSLIVSDVDLVGDNQNGIDFFHYVQKNYPELVDKFVFFTGNSAAAEEHYRYVAKGAATSKDLKAAISAPAPGRARRGTKAPTQAPATRRAPTVQDVVDVVREVAPRIQAKMGPENRPSTRFGDRKVFVSALWREAAKDPRMSGLSLDQFKEALVKAHRERMLTLARADLVAAMDTDAVAASEIAADNARFHFVIDPTFQPAGAPAPRAPIYISPPPRSAAPPPASGGQPSTEQIAQAVKAALPSIKGSRDNGFVGRFGESKVFIGSIWPIVSRQYPDLTRGQFDHALLTANRQGLLSLARLDIRGGANPDAIATSEISDGSYTVHFVIDPNGPGW